MRSISARGNRLGRLKTTPARQMARTTATFQVGKRSIAGGYFLPNSCDISPVLAAPSVRRRLRRAAPAGCGLVQDLGDRAARDPDPDVLGDLHQQVSVVLDLDHGADDAAGGQHLVAALERPDHLAMRLHLLLLRPDQEEIEHHEDQHQRHQRDQIESCRGAACRLGVGWGDGHRVPRWDKRGVIGADIATGSAKAKPRAAATRGVRWLRNFSASSSDRRVEGSLQARRDARAPHSGQQRGFKQPGGIRAGAATPRSGPISGPLGGDAVLGRQLTQVHGASQSPAQAGRSSSMRT